MQTFPDRDGTIAKGSEKSNYFPLCCNIENLAVIGSGYPLYLELIYQIGLLFLLMTVIYFIPVLVFIIKAHNNDPKLNKDFLAVFGLGSLIGKRNL